MVIIGATLIIVLTTALHLIMCLYLFLCVLDNVNLQLFFSVCGVIL